MPIYWAFLTYILLKPTNIKPEDLWIHFVNMDKVIHISIFVALGFCYRVAFPQQKNVVFLGIMATYAMLTEILQETMQLGRSFELMDFVADMLGIIIGNFIWKKSKSIF